MKKFITIIVAFMSVLTLWGQTDEDINIKGYLEYFQQNRNEVILQAKQKSYIEDADTAQIISVINDAEYLCNNYKNIATIDNTLSSQIKKELTEFCIIYSINISANGESISIGTNNFLKTIQKYQVPFNNLREQVEESLSSSSLGANDDDNSDDSNTPGNPIQNESSMSLLYVLIILSLIIGITSVVLTVLTLNEVKKKNKEANKPKTSTSEKANIEVPNKKSHKDKTKDKTGGQTTDTPSVPPGTESAYPTQPSMQYNNVVATPSAVPERKENINKVPQETYLYAIANANVNGEIGLYKVTTENSGDKVFMIILKKADDENGDFTIAPMSDNFMRVAIADRNTYLPSQFCESTLNSPNPTRIEVIEKGKARKVGGKWQMQERMKIRLI